MPITQQVLKKIKVYQLKGLRDVEIEFTSKYLTAILGPNGSGKSTIIHALACINNPVAGTVNHRLSEFFTPTTHSTWTGSSFDIWQDYTDGANQVTNYLMRFRKQASRWAPRYVRRVQRYVSFIGIRTCVPMIENETQQSRIRFNTTPKNDNISRRVRELAGVVMNRNYDTYNDHRFGNKTYIGVNTGGIDYSSLTMGAGEQRIFYILNQLVAAPRNGLILIDEIDLLLHNEALIRLLTIINTLAEQKDLQIIFTTHSHMILDQGFIHFVHLYQTPARTLAFTETKPDALQRLTGHHTRPLELFIEDDLAYNLVKKISAEEGLARFVSIKKYGAAINCFSAVAGAILNQLDNFDNMLFVLDGDEYSTPEEKLDKIQRVLTGNEANADTRRLQALQKITQFNIPAGQSPERYYHNLIINIDPNILTTEEQEIGRVARLIIHPNNSHDFFDDLILRMNYDREVGLSKLVDLLAKTAEWPVIKEPISLWLQQKRQLVEEI